MTVDNIKEILEQHRRWLHNEGGCEADLRWANLTGANLTGADLTRADLREANLTRADLREADLTRANLRWADLTRANLQRTNLRGANLQRANLRWAVLTGADLTGASLPHFQLCPQEGAFVAYKALANSAVAKLRIPEGAARTSSLVGRKCRAEFVEVLEIIGKDSAPIPHAVGLHDPSLIYTTGQTIHPDRYDPDIRIECTHGIHFFMTREEAREY